MSKEKLSKKELGELVDTRHKIVDLIDGMRSADIFTLLIEIMAETLSMFQDKEAIILMCDIIYGEIKREALEKMEMNHE